MGTLEKRYNLSFNFAIRDPTIIGVVSILVAAIAILTAILTNAITIHAILTVVIAINILRFFIGPRKTTVVAANSTSILLTTYEGATGSPSRSRKNFNENLWRIERKW